MMSDDRVAYVVIVLVCVFVILGSVSAGALFGINNKLDRIIVLMEGEI